MNVDSFFLLTFTLPYSGYCSVDLLSHRNNPATPPRPDGGDPTASWQKFLNDPESVCDEGCLGTYRTTWSVASRMPSFFKYIT